MPNPTSDLQIDANRDRRVDADAIRSRKPIAKPGGKPIKVVRDSQDVLDKDSFLKLLIKQLSNQDPLEPVNDREFIAQMAQFTALEQMSNMAKQTEKMASGVSSMQRSMAATQANSMVGKIVTGNDFVNHQPIRGIVSKVVHDRTGQVILMVNGRGIRLEEVKSVEVVSRETIAPKQINIPKK